MHLYSEDSAENLALFAHDVDAYHEQLVALYWHALKAFVLRRVASLQDAEDLVQEAFLRAYLALERYSPEQIRSLKARSWLYKIAWNICCNHVTRSRGSALVSLDLMEGSDLLEREGDAGEQPEAAFERMEHRQELEKLIATLPPHYGVVVSLYYFEDLTYQEVADILNQPLGTVKVYVRRGIHMLRKTLSVQMNEAG